jgi:hypothetical protein
MKKSLTAVLNSQGGDLMASTLEEMFKAQDNSETALQVYNNCCVAPLVHSPPNPPMAVSPPYVQYAAPMHKPSSLADAPYGNVANPHQMSQEA